MPDLMPPQTVLTPNDAANQLQSRGLDALGLASPLLATGWASATPAADDHDAAALRLTLANPRAPFKAPLVLRNGAPEFAQADGSPVTGPVAVLKLHPEAARRLVRLVHSRLAAPGAALTRPVPVAMLVHGVTLPATPLALNWFSAGEVMGLGASRAVSFHCARGLPICPLAVAALFADLIGAFPALVLGDAAMPAPGANGGLDGIVALGPQAIRVQVLDPHGRVFVPTRPEAQLKVTDAADAEQAVVGASGLVTLAAGQGLGRASGDAGADTAAAQPLLWGWSPSGFLDRARLVPPTLPAGVNLPHQFLRVVAVDLPWHLLGNRSDATLDGVPADDGAVPDFALPVVRPRVANFDYLSTANDVLGACSAVAAGFPPGAGLGALALLCSPAIDPALPLPAGPGAVGQWPAFPATPVADNTETLLSDPVTALSAAFRDPAEGADARLDVVVTLAASALPGGTHVRVYPRCFVTIDAIDGDQPSFVRDDGGAALVQPRTATPMLLVNPFCLAAAAPLPNPARLLVDLVVTGRDGRRRLLGGIELAVATGPQPFADNMPSFGGVALLNTPPLQALTSAFGATAVAPASLFGIAPAAPPAGGAPAGFLDLVRRLANETTAPRQGPRLPTQGRFETVLALGRQPGAGEPRLAWRSVLSGARWTLESRSARPELGDPGNPAGADVHAAGVRVDGQLAYDLALHAIERAQPVLPLSGATPGWLVATGGDNWNDPAPDAAGANATVAGVMLETLAAFCDSPELGLSSIPVPGPVDSVQNAVNALAALLGVPPPTITVANEARLKRQLQREMVTARSGQRDALWSLTRAIEHAREFVYIEGPAFARTARPTAAPIAHEIDLVERLRLRMAANPRLKVMICVPRWPDMAPQKAPWVRTALAHRKAAIEALTTQDRHRVAAFHPIGFPGRSAVLRSTTVIVDDVYALVGTSHWRRRGLTFDGGCDVASLDRALDAQGRSSAIVRFRQELMAAKLGLAVPTGPANSNALFTRLADAESAFELLADLLAQGGGGRINAVWAGPTDNRVIPQTDARADPDGVDAVGSRLLSDLSGLLGDA